jgi:hypothetical protein
MAWKAIRVFSLNFILLPSLATQAQDVDVPGNLTMVDSTATEGNILKAGAPFLHNFGMGNTFLGSNAGNLTMIGRENTATGFHALLNNTSGAFNTAAGFQALLSNTEGNVNTASGWNALASNTIGSDNTASGYNALLSNTTGELNTASGVGALRDNTTGSSNTASGYRALFSNITGAFNTAIGYGADVTFGADLTNATVIGANAVVDASNKIRLGDAQVTVIEGEVGFTASSDRNKKENFRPVNAEEVLAQIRRLSLTSWNFIGHDPRRFRHYGPMAQDFFAAFGHDGIGTIGTPTSITSTDMDGVLMIAAQALEKRTLKQEERSMEQAKEIRDLRAENTELKARLEVLERRIGSNALAKAE